MIDRNHACITTVNRLDGLMQEFALTLKNRPQDDYPELSVWRELAERFVNWVGTRKPDELFVPIAEEVTDE